MLWPLEDAIVPLEIQIYPSEGLGVLAVCARSSNSKEVEIEILEPQLANVRNLDGYWSIQEEQCVLWRRKPW